MGFRYRKSTKIGPIRLNASKSGLGWSVGSKGIRYTKKAGGGSRTTASVPGTGLSWVEESSSNKKKASKQVVNSEIKSSDKVASNSIQNRNAWSPYPEKLRKHAKISSITFVILLLLFFFAPAVLILPFLIVGIYAITTFARMAIYQSKHKDEFVKNNAELKKEQTEMKKEVVESPRLIEIKQQMVEAGVSDLFGTKKEVQSLPEIMADDEVLLYATSGFVDKGTVLVVVTDQRLIFVNRGMIFGTDFREIPFSKINGVSYSKKLVFANVSIDNGVNTTLIDNVTKETAPIFVDTLKKAINDAEQQKNAPVVSTPAASVADELLKLKSLLDAGVLTQEEFDAQKAKVLG